LNVLSSGFEPNATKRSCGHHRIEEECLVTPPNDPVSKKNRLTPAYIVFHLLFSEDTWRVAIGIVMAVLTAPALRAFDHTGIGRYVMFVTVVVVGWAIAKSPSQWIVRQLRLLLPNQ
jgi:hypothetical protein